MKRFFALLLSVLLIFCGCASTAEQPLPAASTPAEHSTAPAEEPETVYTSAFDSETQIRLSDGDIDISGPNSEAVTLTHDIIYYEDRDTYESGNPYGEGEAADRHTADEAAAHTVVNITAAGAYRVSGKLSAGQIRVDLGKDANEDATAVVELILDDADITCTVAPAILFLNVYECDGNRSEDSAKPDVDTAGAGANLILEGENTVSGSYVARIYKDKKGEKKLWKQDGAIYSYMSMEVFGPGALELNAENEGMDTELHLTVNGGDITIRSGNDGINTNEDGVSVTTVNGGRLYVIAGLGEEGDGIDSNGYLVINGGTVVASANPASDAGLDSDLGSFIHGGMVIALGSAMDWAESESGQVTMNLQFAQYQAPTDAIVITAEDGREIFSYDPAADAVLGENARRFIGAIISCPDFRQGDTYQVYVGDQQMMYTGTDVMMRPGGMDGDFGGFGGEMPAPPEGFGGEMPALPEGFGGKMPAPPEDFGGEMPAMPEGEMPGGDRGNRGEMGGDRGGKGGYHQAAGAGNALFYMQDMVNFFSGLTAVTE